MAAVAIRSVITAALAANKSGNPLAASIMARIADTLLP
jgi:hypothetical protein